MGVYSRKYKFNGGDGLYYHSNQTISWTASGWSIVEGDTTHVVANVLTIGASVVVNRHNSGSSSTCKWGCILNFNNGVSIESNIASGTISSAGSNSTRTVSFSEAQVGSVSTLWDSLSSVTSDIDSSGSWTNWSKHPLYITITFNDELYAPSIVNFSAARYNNGVIDSQNGTEIRAALHLTTKATTTKTDKESYIKIHYIQQDGSIATQTIASSISTINNSWLDIDKTYTLSGTFPTANAYDFILEFCYYGEVQTSQYSVGPGFCNFYLSNLSTGGVAIGKRSSATLGNPLFECSYPTYFYEPVTFVDGVSGIPKFAYGQISVAQTSSGSYRDTPIDYTDAGFTNPPTVVCGFWSGSTAGTFGRCCVASYDVTKTGCTARFFNGDSSARSPQITWIAIGT